MVGFKKEKQQDTPERQLFLFTTEILPQHFVIKEMFNMIEIYDSILISKKSVFKRVFSRKKNQGLEVYNEFVSAVPEEANAILGVRTATSTAIFSDGTYLVLTHSGTPAIIEKIEAGE